MWFMFEIKGKTCINGKFGFCEIHGSINKNGLYNKFNVYLYEYSDSGLLVDFLIRKDGPVGDTKFALRGVPAGEYLLVVRDATGVSNAVVADRVSSVLPTVPFRFIPAGE